MCGGKTKKTTQTSTQTAAPASEAMQYYQQLMGKLQGIGQLGYTPYQGERVAGFTPYQQQAMQGIAGLQGAGAGTLQEAVRSGMRGAAPITGGDIQRYQDPYQQMVIDAMSAKMRQQEAEDISKLQGQSISAGAFGGDRAKLAQAQMMRNQEQERNMRMSELMSKGYSNALAAAQADREAATRGAGMLQTLAGAEFTQPLAQTQALYGAGAQQQALEQQRLNVPYETYLEQRAFPYQQLQYLAGLGTGVGSQMGGTTTGQATTTQPGPNRFSQIAGLGLSLGLAPFTGGMSLAAAPGLVQGLGQKDGGRVEKADGGGLSKTGMFAKGYIPEIDPVRGRGAPGFSSGFAPAADSEERNSSGDIVNKAMSLAQKMKGSTDPTNPASWQTTTSLSPENAASWSTSVIPTEAVSPMSPSMLFPSFAHGGGINVPHYDDGGGVGSSFSDALSKYLLNQYLAYKDPTAALSRAGETIGKVFEPLQPYARSYIEPYLSKDEEVKTATSPRNLIGPLSETAQNIETKSSEDEKFKSPQIQYSPYTTSDIATIMDKNIAADKAPISTSETANLPEIVVPPKGEPSAGIDKAYGEGEVAVGTAKGSSLLGGLLGLSPEAEQAGFAAGLSMMAGESPFALSNIGAGGMAGMKYYNELMKAKQEQALKREEIEKKYSRANLIKTDMVRKTDGTQVWKDKTNPDILVGSDNIPLRTDEIMPKKEYDEKKKSGQKFDEDKINAKRAYRSYMLSSDRMKDDISEIIRELGPLTTGFLGKPLSQIPGTKSAYVRSLLNSLKNSLGMQQIERLKQMSKTGATGFGSLTEKEFERIAESIATVQQDLAVEDLEKNLAKIMKSVNSSLNAYKQDFLEKFTEEDIPEYKPSTETTESIVSEARGKPSSPSFDPNKPFEPVQ